MEETRQEKTYGVAFAGEEETTIYNSFVKELTEWAKDGSLPESGNQDIAYYLELQQNRLKERNIRMEYRFSDRAGKKGTPRFQMTDLFPKVTDFSYDYFLSKVVSLLKIILFTDDRSNLAVCQGKVAGDAFRDIVDIAYQGTTTLSSCQVEGKYCYLDINLFMSDIHDGGNRIYKKNDIFRMKLCKDITKPEDYGFSIRKVQCRGCGGSFDASRIRYCPCLLYTSPSPRDRG